MDMIHQLNRSNGQPTPYFIRGKTGPIPYATAHLTLDYGYPCSPHCRGLAVPPWLGSAAAPAPMLELDRTVQLELESQLQRDQNEFSEDPHPLLNDTEGNKWRNYYARLISYNPDERTNRHPREKLRALHALAMGRQVWWASQQAIAPAPPHPQPHHPR
ncbi:hypothetical protein BDR22DRAFT_888644 [Usnea florida]